MALLLLNKATRRDSRGSGKAEHLDKILTMSGEKFLPDAGSISHEDAIEKATTEYKKYQQKTLSEAEKNYLESLKVLENMTKRKEK